MPLLQNSDHFVSQRHQISCVALILLFCAQANRAMTAPPEANYDEANVPPYTLPDPLTDNNGQPVTSPDDWQKRRRPELLDLFGEHVYGRSPTPPKMEFEVTSESS